MSDNGTESNVLYYFDVWSAEARDANSFCFYGLARVAAVKK